MIQFKLQKIKEENINEQKNYNTKPDDIVEIKENKGEEINFEEPIEE